MCAVKKGAYVMIPKNLNRPQITPQALKLKQAAEYLGVSPVSVRRLIKRGLIKPIRALRHILIPVCALDRFLAGGSNDTPEADYEAASQQCPEDLSSSTSDRYVSATQHRDELQPREQG